MVVKRALGCFVLLMLASGLLWAQGPKVAHTTSHGTVVPFQPPSTPLKTIYSNLGPTASNSYFDESGYYVLGPNNSVGDGEQWIATPFTPASNAHVSEISAAVGWISGEKAFFLGLYSDDGSGDVGTLIAQGETNKLPVFGTCCETANVSITSSAVTAGTQYWIVAQTDDTNAPAFTGVFMSSNSSTIAYNPETEGWFTFSGNVPAVLVRGTIP